MAKYMLILGGADLDKRDGNPAFMPVMLERYLGWIQSLRERGKLVASYKLNDRTGARLSVRGGEVVEGPFVETKEAVGGLFIVEAGSLEEAKALGRECPVLAIQNGNVEVRLMDEPRAPPAR